MQAETRYAKSGGVSIAYQTVGDTDLDLVFIPGFVSHLEIEWEEPSCARFRERLASFARLILLDKRGTGLSDRVADMPTLEQRMDDVRAVLDAVGSRRAAVFGVSEGGVMATLFAATYPDRTAALVLYGSMASAVWDETYPWGATRPFIDQFIDWLEQGWGTQEVAGVFLAAEGPSVAGDERFQSWFARFLRFSASPGAAGTLLRMNRDIDIRAILPTIHVPTLVLHRPGERMVQAGHSRFLADNIPGAKYVELPGIDHFPFAGEPDALVDEVQEFLTGMRESTEPDRVLATVLFTDIVGSTERLAEMGDRRGRDLLAAHHVLLRREIARFRGREINTSGDGFLAAFDGPARAIRCATAASTAVRELGIDIRAGVHTGECERIGEQLGGIAVHIGARVAASAGPGEVLVSSTVKDLVAGSGIRFADRGTHGLKGVPGEWHLFAVEN